MNIRDGDKRTILPRVPVTKGKRCPSLGGIDRLPPSDGTCAAGSVQFAALAQTEPRDGSSISVEGPAPAPSDPRTPTVSIIIPVHIGGESFRRCLEALGATITPPEEVIVIVDGVVEGIDELAARPGLAILRTAGGCGPAAARNVGARVARGDVLLFIDSDVVVGTTIVGDVAHLFAGDPELDAVIGSYDDAPGSPDFLSQYKNLLHHYMHQNAREDGHTFWGACGAIRRDVFLGVGGFDERYCKPCIEDIELGHRLKRAGYRIAVRKSLQVKHLKRWTPASLISTDIFRRALPWTELILKTGHLENDLNTDWSSRIKVALTCVMTVALVLALRWHESLFLDASIAVLLPELDVHLLHFFWRKRGLLFTLQVIPWIWFYYLYSGFSFGTGLALHWIQSGPVRKSWTAALAGSQPDGKVLAPETLT